MHEEEWIFIGFSIESYRYLMLIELFIELENMLSQVSFNVIKYL